MLLKYSAMRFLGAADQPAGAQRGSVGIRWLSCEQLVDDKVYCAGDIFDLRTGLIERQRGPSGLDGETGKLAPVSDGRRRTQRAPCANWPTLEQRALTMEIILVAGKVAGIYLLDEPAFQSNMNQMFMLGRFDMELFEETYNEFPYARVFRVRAGSK